MNFIHNKTFQKALITVISLTFAVSLTARILLSLPFFYEQPSQQRAYTFVIVFLVLVIFIALTSYFLILPYSKLLVKWKNIFFIFILTAIIATTSLISATHYWSRPEKHRIEICFDASDGATGLDIKKLTEPKTNRLFSPKSFGFSHYPISVPSGECIQGQMVTLYWRFPLRYILRIMNVVVQENPPDGRLYIAVNDNPAVVYFDQDADEPVGTEILFTEGFDQGKVLPFARNKYISLGVKSIALIFSAIYLSLLLFGLTEKILHAENEVLAESKSRN
jgi:hypothetical protein